VGTAGAPGRAETEPGHDPLPRAGRSERVYAGLIRAYPAPFRDRYEDELLVLFRDQLRDARTAGRGGATAMLWLQAVRDLAFSALGEHLRKDRTMAQSLTTFEPTRTMRLLGLVGLVGGILLLWAFISFEPFATLEANTIRLLTFCLGGAAIAAAFYRRQAGVTRSIALVTTGAVVVSGVVYATLLVLAQLVESPFSGAFGTINFWSSAALWLTAALYGAAMLKIGAAWQGMSRWLGVATRVGAIALLGSVFAWTGDDRLGLVDSERFGQLWTTIALSGVFLNGIGWVILGAALAFGTTRPVDQPDRPGDV
jgi:hypothetical protein